MANAAQVAAEQALAANAALDTLLEGRFHDTVSASQAGRILRCTVVENEQLKYAARRAVVAMDMSKLAFEVRYERVQIKYGGAMAEAFRHLHNATTGETR